MTLWTIACQAPLSRSQEFSKQEYWNELPFPPPGDLPHPGLKPASSVAPTLAGRFFTRELPGKPVNCFKGIIILFNPHNGMRQIVLLYSTNGHFPGVSDGKNLYK